MKEMMAAIINATKDTRKKDAISADDLMDTLVATGYTEEEASSIINKANKDRVIRIIFSLAAQTADDPNAQHTVVTLL